MYPNSQAAGLPAQALTLGGQYVPPAPYDFPAYSPHLFTGVSESPVSTWSSLYAPSREEYQFGFPGASPTEAGQGNYSSSELSSAPGGGSVTSYSFLSGGDPFSQRRRPPEPFRQTPLGGKTRTKDKYRVVYTDHQRLELEKEFQCNRYITIRRKTELSAALSLSERQVKIWFQNRRAKERKINRKKLQNSQQASTTTPTPLGGHADLTLSPRTSSSLVPDSKPEEY